MTYVFNQVDFVHRLERAGLGREVAETIAQGIDESRRDSVTVRELEMVLAAELAKALGRQTIQFGIMLTAGLALAVSVIGFFFGTR